MHACVYVWCVFKRKREAQKGYWRSEETNMGRKVRIERMRMV